MFIKCWNFQAADGMLFNLHPKPPNQPIEEHTFNFFIKKFFFKFNSKIQAINFLAITIKNVPGLN